MSFQSFPDPDSIDYSSEFDMFLKLSFFLRPPIPSFKSLVFPLLEPTFFLITFQKLSKFASIMSKVFLALLSIETHPISSRSGHCSLTTGEKQKLAHELVIFSSILSLPSANQTFPDKSSLPKAARSFCHYFQHSLRIFSQRELYPDADQNSVRS